MPQKRGRGRGFYYACGVRGHWEASLGSIAEMLGRKLRACGLS